MFSPVNSVQSFTFTFRVVVIGYVFLDDLMGVDPPSRPDSTAARELSFLLHLL
ncbi:hypothetical protein CU098_008655, partial [Rhizopus stolonifer]